MNKKLMLLIVGCLLVVFGIFKPDLSNIFVTPDSSPVVMIQKPSNEDLLDECAKVTESLSKVSSSSYDANRLASLYMDLATLVDLDGEDEVVRNTDDLRQVNSLSGLMLKINIRGKYPELAEAAKSVIVASIGDDNIPLTKELRVKAVEGLRALAWACKEGGK